MTEGLVLAGAWGEFGVLIGLFLYFVLRHSAADPGTETERPTPDSEMEPPPRG